MTSVLSFSLQALYELVKCNFNAEEALRRLHFNVKVFNGNILWAVCPSLPVCASMPDPPSGL